MDFETQQLILENQRHIMNALYALLVVAPMPDCAGLLREQALVTADFMRERAAYRALSEPDRVKLDLMVKV